MGWIREWTGGFTAGLLTLAAILVVGAGLVLSIHDQAGKINGPDPPKRLTTPNS
jgi:hypothetical protein